MATAAELLVLLKAKDELSAVTKSAGASLTGLGTAATSAGRALATIGTAAVVAGVGALALGLSKAVTQAAEFEQVMSGVKAVSGATAPEMANLSALALQLGANTSFSATEAGRGIEELVKAGVSLADVMGGAAAASLSLAAAGEITVAEAAEIAANAMNTFNLKGSDMAHVSDVIAGAANASAIDVNQFRLSLAASGAVAATVGFSFDDLATAIAVMGQAGIKGSDAGTSLKTMMLNLQPVTDKQIALFQELGLLTEEGGNAFFDASGKVKSMADVAQTLQDALAGMTQQQKLATLETIFGSDAIRAAAVLANAGAAGFNQMAESMGKVTAEAVAAERLNNLNGSLEILKGSLQTAAVTIGTAFLPALRQIVDAATALVNENMPQIEMAATAMAAAFVAALPSIVAFFQTLIENREIIAQVAAGLAALVVISTVIGWILALISTFAALGSAIAVVASLFAPVVAGVLAVGTALASIGTVAALAWSSIAAGAGVFSTLGAAAALIVGILGGPVTVAIIGIIAVVAALAAAWATNFGDIQGVTQSAVDAIGSALTTAGEFFMNLGATVASAWEGIQAATAAAGTGLSTTMAEAWAAVQAATGAALAALGAAIIAAWETIFTGETRAAFAALVADAQMTWDAIVTLVTAALAALQAGITAAWIAIQAAIVAANAAITADVTTAWATITTNVTTAMAAIDAAVQSGWATVQSNTTSALAAVSAAVKSAWDAMAPTVSAALQSVSGAATSGWNSIRSAVQGILNGLISAAGSAGSAMVNAWAQGVTSRISAALSAARRMAEQVRELLNGSDAAKGPLSDTTAAGRALPETLAKGVLAGMPSLLRAVDSMAGGMASLTGMSGGLSLATAGGAASSTGGGSVSRNLTIQVNAPIYGVNDMEDVVIRALDRAGRRGRV